MLGRAEVFGPSQLICANACKQDIAKLTSSFLTTDLSVNLS
jgi:hypothetical protein